MFCVNFFVNDSINRYSWNNKQILNIIQEKR
jgi:hypothetical protein